MTLMLLQLFTELNYLAIFYWQTTSFFRQELTTDNYDPAI